MSAHHDPTVPRGLLIAAMGLVIGTLIIVTFVRLTGISASQMADAPAASVLMFRAADLADGSVAIYDAAGERMIDRVAPGTGGFIRGTMRGLARERQRQGVSPMEPFRLTGRLDGRLTLEDPTTGRRVDLESFGPTNAAVFANFFTAAGTTLHAAARSEIK